MENEKNKSGKELEPYIGNKDESRSYGNSRSDNDGLERDNGYCGCPELQGLYEKRRTAESLEKRCEESEIIINLEEIPHKSMGLLGDYQRTLQEFVGAVEDYHKELTNYVHLRKVDLILCGEKNKNFKKINPDHFDEHLNSSDLPITLNCYNCNQQIDLFEGFESSI